jgi:DNA-binding response OmpR family regulator
MHALIIEDESLIAMAIEDALRGCGFTSFDVAVSAEGAAAAAARKCPDLITADVELRPGCGITAVQSICSELPIPVLFITASPGEVRIRMPSHTLIEKPFCPDDLMAAVKQTLEIRGLKGDSVPRRIRRSTKVDGNG